MEQTEESSVNEKAVPSLMEHLKEVCWIRFIQSLCWISIFSFLGSAARVGLEGIQYDGQIVPSLVWAQFFGCVAIGAFQKDTTLFREKESGKRINRPLHIGITVGFCGSITSFSSWAFDIFSALASPPPVNYGYNLISAASQLVVTLGFSFVGYYFGAHMSALLSATAAKKEGLTLPALTSPIWATVVIVFGTLCLIGAALLTAFLSSDSFRGLYGFTLVFSPFGAVLRFILSKINLLCGLDKREFPMGTFIANILGSIIYGIVFTIQFYSPSYLPCQVLSGIQLGFCGALTTVSTFIKELAEMESFYNAYRYGSVTVVLGVLTYVVTVGIRVWSVGGGSFAGQCNFTNSSG